MSETIIVSLITALSVILEAVIIHRQSVSEKQQKDAHERMEIIMAATEASLEGLKQLGANGQVTECLHTLNGYKNKKAAS